MQSQQQRPPAPLSFTTLFILCVLQAHPPFRIYAVSQPMPIINSAHPRNPVWTDVSFPMSLDLLPETNQVSLRPLSTGNTTSTQYAAAYTHT
jgi:hypothetical protein